MPDFPVSAVLDGDPLATPAYVTIRVVAAPLPPRGRGLCAPVHDADVHGAVLRASNPQVPPLGTTRGGTAVPIAELARPADILQPAGAPRLNAEMTHAVPIAVRTALLLAPGPVAVVRAAPFPRERAVAARVAPAQAPRGRAPTVAVAEARGVAGAVDLGGAGGRDARVRLAEGRADVDRARLVAGLVAAAVEGALRVRGVGAPRGAGRVAAAV